MLHAEPNELSVRDTCETDSWVHEHAEHQPSPDYDNGEEQVGFDKLPPALSPIPEVQSRPTREPFIDLQPEGIGPINQGE